MESCPLSECAVCGQNHVEAGCVAVDIFHNDFIGIMFVAHRLFRVVPTIKRSNSGKGLIAYAASIFSGRRRQVISALSFPILFDIRT